MSYLAMTEEEIHACVELGGLDDDMFFGLHEDAKERVQKLEDVLWDFLNWTTDESGKKSLLDDEELWKRVEEVLK